MMIYFWECVKSPSDHELVIGLNTGMGDGSGFNSGAANFGQAAPSTGYMQQQPSNQQPFPPSSR